MPDLGQVALDLFPLLATAWLSHQATRSRQWHLHIVAGTIAIAAAIYATTYPRYLQGAAILWAIVQFVTAIKTVMETKK